MLSVVLLPDFITKHWACSRSDIDWKAEGIRSSALEFVAYALGFFHDGHRAAKDVLKTRGYFWSPGEFGRPKCWYRDVSDADKPAEVSWLRENVMGPDQRVWALRITARDRYSDRCWCWGEPLGISLEGAVDRPGRRWNGVMTPDVAREG